MAGMRGTEALGGGSKGGHKGGGASKAKKPAKGGRKLHRVISTMLDDGSVHHSHEYKKADGSFDPQTEEYSSATPDDAGAHVAEAMGGGGADPSAAGDPTAAAGAPGAGAGADPGAMAGM